MRPDQRTSYALLALLLSFLVIPVEANPPLASDGGEAKRPEIRIGVIYYKDFEAKKEEYRNILSRLLESSKFEGDFLLSVGTFDDVLSWYQKELIDVAILSPGTVGRILTLRDERVKLKLTKALKKGYIGTCGIKAGNDTFATEDRKNGNELYRFRSVCVVNRAAFPEMPAGGKVHIDRIISRAQEGKVKFLFVHPTSTSGYILPKFLLKKRLQEALQYMPFEWTYNHSLSMQRLDKEDEEADTSPFEIKVAFVSDETSVDRKKHLQVEFPELDRKEISQDLVFISPKLRKMLKDESENRSEEKPLSQLKTMFSEHNREPYFESCSKDKSRPYSKSHPCWLDELCEVGQWIQEIDPNYRLGAPAMSIEQIGSILRNYEYINRKSDKPLRLALVLSGGGAKCAYQLGAVEALEQEFCRYTDKGNPSVQKVEIGLVVGTSGGAINALCIALGLSKTPENQRALRKIWKSFKQNDFLHPWAPIRGILGWVIGAVTALLIIWFVFLLEKRTRNLSLKRIWTMHHWWFPSGIAMIALGFLEAAVVYAGYTSWHFVSTTGEYRYLQHLWAIGAPSLRWCALALVVFGFAILLIGWFITTGRFMYSSQRKRVFVGMEGIHTFRRLTVNILALLLLVLIIVGFIDTLFREDSLFDSKGIEQAIFKKIPELLEPHLIPEDSHDIESLSTKVASLLKRDLIITGSRLAPGADEGTVGTSKSLSDDPTDLYFYYRPEWKGGPDVPPLDNRFKPLRQYSGKLLDVVIGSSSIYPIFQAKSITLPEGSVEIIDGGFIHNSPIEAALLWKATHIIVIEASPYEQPTKRPNLLENSVSAFNYLYNQAQMIDSRSKGQVEVFTLRPQTVEERESGRADLNSGVLDFIPEIVEGAFHKGYNDAMNTVNPVFRREPGPSTQNTLISLPKQTGRTSR